MRISSVRISPVARVLAIVYAAFGVVMWLQFALGSAEELTLPLGVVAPLFYLNFNLHLQRSGGLLYNIFLCAASVLSYFITGWITGLAGAACFNLVAKHSGGIDAKYFQLAETSVTAEPPVLEDHKLGARS